MNIKKKIEEFTDHNFLMFIAFFCISLLIFSPSFLNLDFFWDDERFVFLNPAFMQSPTWYAFWNAKSEYYKSWPLGYAFFWVLIKKFSLESLYFYKTLNIVLHSLNALLVFHFLKKLKISHCLIASMVFLIHPLHVETVSWFFQLLTILSLTFFLVSINFFLSYLEKENFLFLILSIFLFLFSLWTKSIALLAPFLFLVILWVQKSNVKKYLFLIPFFFVSFYVGIVNIKGTSTLSHGLESRSIEQNSFFNIIDGGARSLMSENTRRIVEDDSSKYFNYLYPQRSKKTPKALVFNRLEIFKQGIWHYFSKTLAPFNLQFIYRTVDTSLVYVFIALFFTAGIPIYFYYKTKSRQYLLIPFLSIIFLAPYLGLTFITFFYWSPVSDRYTYYFILVLVLTIAYFESSKIKNIRIFLSIYLVILGMTSFNYGYVFNTPLLMYEKIVKSKPHPAIYSLLFEQYLIRTNLERASEVLKEGISKFPEDGNLKNDQLRLKALQNSMEHHNGL